MSSSLRGIVSAMKTRILADGTIHQMPADLRAAIAQSEQAAELWEDITPLARNEWICWVEQAKKQATRERRIAVGISKMKSGMRRPCCWAGCVHRNDKPMSSTQQWLKASGKL